MRYDTSNAYASLRFRGEYGRQVWENVHDATDLLAGAESYHILEGCTRRELECELITFLALAAFRHRHKKHKPDFTVQENLERMKNSLLSIGTSSGCIGSVALVPFLLRPRHQQLHRFP